MKNPLSHEEEKPVSGPEIQKMQDLAQYQTGSVVSRTVMSKKTGTVTAFAFAEGQGLTEHTSPYDAMVQILDGEAEIKISQMPYHLKAGDMIVMPAGRPHALHALTAFKMLLILIRS